MHLKKSYANICDLCSVEMFKDNLRDTNFFEYFMKQAVSSLKILKTSLTQKVLKFVISTKLSSLIILTVLAMSICYEAETQAKNPMNDFSLPKAMISHPQILTLLPCVQLSDPNKFYPNFKGKKFIKVPRKVLES